VSLSQRRGARSPTLVPENVKRELEAGAPSVNHMEQMAIDMGALLTAAFPELAADASMLRRDGFVTRMRAGGRVLAAAGTEAIGRAATHRSDTVRGWAAMAVAAQPSSSLADRLETLRAFADDEHFAVREWAWLAARPAVVAEPYVALQLLRVWAEDPSPNVRRFASEATRPRGVWSVHIPELKQRPEDAETLLSALCADPSRYVQDSVGNWLNDASRTRPDWVRAVCARWTRSSSSAATERVCRRALRTVDRRVPR
jgi:3-methyladenine DNA glycosylase AlkC